MTGIGGGSLMTPMLILVFGVTPVTAIGSDLAYAAVTKTVGGYKHWKQRTVDFTLSSWMAVGSVAAVLLGLSVGFVLGVTSAGSGALIAVGLILLFRLTPQRVVGTDVFHAAILLWAAGLAHVTAGNVDFGLAGTILVGSVPGVWLGSHWSVRVEPAVLRTTLAVVLIGAGLALLIKAGLDLPIAVIVPFPVAVIALLVVTMIRARKASTEVQA